MYRHILCVYPYRKDLKRTRCFPPIGLEYIAATLAPHCREIEVVDLRHEDSLTADFIRSDTDVVCFSVNWKRDIDFIREQIRSVGRKRTIIVGGRHATEEPEKWLKDCPNIDTLVCGDGEETVEEIARGIPLKRIAGISYRLNGKIIHNQNRKYKPFRDDLFPNRRLRRYDYRFDIEGIKTGWTFDSLAASRGCPFNCKFCSFNLNPWGEKRSLTMRSPESIVRELEEIDADIIAFTDDIFTHDMDWVEAICDLILEKGIKKHYIVNARLEMARRMDVVAKMERTGFAALLLGIESTQDRTLRSMSKGLNIKQIEKYCDMLKRTSMILHGYFILGNIGETEEEMLEIAPFAKRLGLDTLGLSTLRTTPHDGMKELIAANPAYHVGDDGIVSSDAIPPGKLHEIRKRIWWDFYTGRKSLRIVWKLRKNGVLTVKTFAQLITAGIRAAWAKSSPAEKTAETKGIRVKGIRVKP